MSHEELLEKIDAIDEPCLSNHNLTSIIRAVVELHRPSPEGRYERPICVGCSFTETGYYVSYPCRNIQAIQKELA